MSIRPFKLPDDLDTLYTLLVEAFQYPENPEWSADTAEVEGLKDTIQTFKRIWPIFRLTSWMSPALRDALLGFIWEEDGMPVGLINVSRRGTTDSWMIGNVAVLPAYRRRGLARKLVEAALDFIRAQEGQMALLDVIAGNLPAYKLYESLGFVHYTSQLDLELHTDTVPPRPAVPEGYVYQRLPMGEWQLPMAMAKRVVPGHVQDFDPVVKGRYYFPPVLMFLSKLINRMRGMMVEDFALRDAKTQEVAAIGFLTAQTRPGDKHIIALSLEPKHADLVPYLLQYMLYTVKTHSPTHAVGTSLWEWNYFARDAYLQAGFKQRKEGHRMGLRLTP